MVKLVTVSIVSNGLEIDRKKDLALVDRSIAANLSEVFGGDGSFSWQWLLPLPPHFIDFESLAEYSLDASGKRWIEIS